MEDWLNKYAERPEPTETGVLSEEEMQEQVARFKEMVGHEPSRQEMEDFLNEFGTGEPQLVEESEISG